jgi:hypothetical protein
LPSTPFFEVIFDRIEIIQETREHTEFHVRVKKVNKTRAIVGSVILKKPISNEYLAEFKILKKQGLKLT